MLDLNAEFKNKILTLFVKVYLASWAVWFSGLVCWFFLSCPVSSFLPIPKAVGCKARAVCCVGP